MTLNASNQPQIENVPLYTERNRPQYHFTPPRWWMNDPNGLIYFDGEYHLFYQHHPFGLTWGPMHWGHAVSYDLIHWQHMPIALYPDHIGTIFSGSVVADHDNSSGLVPGGGLVAIYSYNNQSQGIAYSTNRGRTWTKYENNPVLPALEKNFRDPKVFWHSQSCSWVMVIAAEHEVRFFRSHNLIQWEASDRFSGGHVGGIWECPDLFPLMLDGREYWVLLVSVNAGAPAGGSGTQYFIGQFDGITFTTDDTDPIRWLDYGPDNYAGVTYNDAPNDERIVMGWMNNWNYANHIPTTTWRGALTLPRKLSLRKTCDDLCLAQEPISALRHKQIALWENVTLKNEDRILDVNRRSIEVEIEVEIGAAKSFGLSFGAQTLVQISYDAHQATLTLRRPRLELPGYQTVFNSSYLPNNGIIRLRVFFDQGSIEVFANDGTTVITAQTFMDTAESQLTAIAKDGEVLIHRLAAYPVEDIWHTKL